jgi:putative SOS response-associated peptidase YedK
MCGRFTLRTPWSEIARKFGIRIADVPELFPRYNIAPSQVVMAIGPSREGTAAPAFFRWGLVPAWAQDAKKAPINARAETAASRPTFAEALRRRRCLIPADGFFEWQQLSAKNKRPWHFALKDDSPFAFAGMWEAWKPGEGAAPLLTCALLTVPANEIVRPVHVRMPAILRPEDYSAWMDRKKDDANEALTLVHAFDASAMKATPVGPFVNDARHEGAECLNADIA